MKGLIYALADLHLSLAKNKPMEIFGYVWRAHTEKIYEAWRSIVKKDDLVIVPGDISWAVRLDEAKVDLNWLSELPGTKLLIKGNHDYWWSTIAKVRSILPRNIYAISSGYFMWEDVLICGTRGWVCPGDPCFDEEKDFHIYQREAKKLEKALENGKRCKHARIIVALHYPPFNYLKAPSLFTDVIEKHGVEVCVYGHLHDAALRSVFDGNLNGVEYRCVSADKLKFEPLQIMPFEPTIEQPLNFVL